MSSRKTTWNIIDGDCISPMDKIGVYIPQAKTVRMFFFSSYKWEELERKMFLRNIKTEEKGFSKGIALKEMYVYLTRKYGIKDFCKDMGWRHQRSV